MDVECDVVTILEKYFAFLSECESLFEKEFDANYEDYKEIDQKEKTIYNNNKRNILPFHER